MREPAGQVQDILKKAKLKGITLYLEKGDSVKCGLVIVQEFM